MWGLRVLLGAHVACAWEPPASWADFPDAISSYMDTPTKASREAPDGFPYLGVPAQVAKTAASQVRDQVGGAVRWGGWERQASRQESGLHGLKVSGNTQLNMDALEGNPSLVRQGEGGWADPAHEFTETLVQLKTAVERTEKDLLAALHGCHERHPDASDDKRTQTCEQDRAVAEVRGRMRRLKVAMQRVASLKPVAFALHREGVHAIQAYENTTALVQASKVRLGSTDMQRKALKLKLDSLQKIEGSWRKDMRGVAKNVLKEKKRLSETEKKMEGADQRRLQFLAKLHAVLEGVAVGDTAAELTYEEAEETLKKAKEREAHAKRMIYQAEHLLDHAYGKVDEGEQQKKAARSAGAPPIIRKAPDPFDNFGKGSTADSPLPLNADGGLLE